MIAATPTYFSSSEEVAWLAAQAAAWIGTPFRAHAAVRGGGVDCVLLCAELMRSCGVLEDYHFPPYALDHAKHQTRSLILDWLGASAGFTSLPAGEKPIAGDLPLFKVGRCVHHAGVMLDHRRFIHALEGPGVVVGQLDDATWGKRLHCVYRPLPLPSSFVIGYSSF